MPLRHQNAAMADWVTEWVDVAVAAGTLILALFTSILAWATKRLADEAVASREADEQPRLVAYPAYDDGMLHVVIEIRDGRWQPTAASSPSSIQSFTTYSGSR